MNVKRTIQKFLFILLWMTIGGGMLTLLVAAISKKNRDSCRNYLISIKGVQDYLFMDENKVLQLLTASGNGKIKGQHISSINLQRMETLLEDNAWIKDAQLYFDNQDMLHIIISERKPVARIFTTESDSYYIDENSFRMPLSDKISARVPVFTGFPEKKFLNKKDSALLAQVKTTALFIISDSFWMSQVAQIDITAQRTFEMIPTVGNHVVLLGDGRFIDKKFHRLFVFYKEILSKAGFNKYPVLDVQYAGQVVATRSGVSKVKVDTTQLRINVQNLLQQSKQIKNETETEDKATNEKPKINADSSTAPLNNHRTNNTEKKSTPVYQGKKQENNVSPQPLKTTLKSRTEEKKETGNKIFKAVMPKKNDQ